jgi:hypothetical protein
MSRLAGFGKEKTDQMFAPDFLLSPVASLGMGTVVGWGHLPLQSSFFSKELALESPSGSRGPPAVASMQQAWVLLPPALGLHFDLQGLAHLL